MSQIVKKDLSIFRGTYNECKSFEKNNQVEDMKIYLAWDTQEIFIGNALGQLVLYGVSKSLFRYIDENFDKVKIEFGEYIEGILRDVVPEITKYEFDKAIEGFINKLKQDVKETTNNLIENAKNEINSLLDKTNSRIDTSLNNIEKLGEKVENNLNNFNLHMTEFKMHLKNAESESEKIKENISVVRNELREKLSKTDEDLKQSINSLKIETNSDLSSFKSETAENFKKINVDLENEVLNREKSDAETVLTITRIKDRIQENEGYIQKNINKINTLETDLNKTNKDLTTANSNISKLNEKVNNIEKTYLETSVFDEHKEASAEEFLILERKLTTQLNQLDSTINSNISTKISELEKTIDENISTEIDNINNNISGINNDIRVARRNIKDIENDVGSLNENLTKLNKTVDKVSVAANKLIYLTGAEMKNMERAIYGDDYLMIFCTEDTTQPNYKAGQLYYYLYDKTDSKIVIAPLAGSGKIEKDKIYSVISNLSIKNWPYTKTSMEISSNNSHTIEIGDVTANITNTNAVASVSLSHNLSAELNGDTIRNNKTLNIDSTRPGSYKISVSAIAKAADDYTEYFITNNTSSKSISFYQPILFGVEGALQHKTSHSGTFTANIAIGDVVYLYTTTKINADSIKTPEGYGAGFTFIPGSGSDGVTSGITVNDVEGLSYYIYKSEAINDTTITVVVS